MKALMLLFTGTFAFAVVAAPPPIRLGSSQKSARQLIVHKRKAADETIFLAKGRSRIKDAPPVYETEPLKLEVPEIICENCASGYYTSGAIDLSVVQTQILSVIKDRDLAVSFSGFAAGELLITTIPTTHPDGRRYYQIRVVAVEYDATSKRFSEYLVIEVAEIALSDGRARARTDRFTASIEELIKLNARLRID
jgi:hypothetical protein